MRYFSSGYDNGRPYKDASNEVVNLGYWEGVEDEDPTATYMEIYSGPNAADISFSVLPDSSMRY